MSSLRTATCDALIVPSVFCPYVQSLSTLPVLSLDLTLPVLSLCPVSLDPACMFTTKPHLQPHTKFIGYLVMKGGWPLNQRLHRLALKI